MDHRIAMARLRAELERIVPMDRLPISGNVPSDVAERLSDQANDRDSFDEFDDDHLGAVLSPAYAEVVGDMLQLRVHAQMAERIEALDKARAFDLLRPMLDRLYRACVDEYRQL